MMILEMIYFILMRTLRIQLEQVDLMTSSSAGGEFTVV